MISNPRSHRLKANELLNNHFDIRRIGNKTKRMDSLGRYSFQNPKLFAIDAASDGNKGG
jgi:hypothetical protein